MAERGTFAEWAILELMGHRRLAGYVTEQQIAGTAFIRLDVHSKDEVVTSQFYSAAAVYAITPTTADIARALGERSKPQPVHRYELEPPRSYADTSRADNGNDDDDDEPPF